MGVIANPDSHASVCFMMWFADVLQAHVLTHPAYELEPWSLTLDYYFICF